MNTSDIKYIDFHCHCDLLPDFESGKLSLESEVAAIAVTTTPLAWPRNIEVFKSRTDIYPALGMHPQLIASRLSDLKIFKNFINEASIVGEIGLDGSPAFRDSLSIQKDILSEILFMCAECKQTKVLSIHSLRAEAKLIELLKIYINSFNLLPVMHWFTGSIAQASKLLDLGAKFSFNYKQLNTKKGKELLVHIPKESVLIETDLPFTINNSYSGLIHKKLLEDTIEQISLIWDKIPQDSSNIIFENSMDTLRRCNL